MTQLPTGLIYDIRVHDAQDTQGVTVFLKGCPLDCWWCAAPEGKQPSPEMKLDETHCVRCGKCVPNCPIEAIQVQENLYTGDPEVEGVITNRQSCTVCGACVDSCPEDAREVVGRRVSVADVMDEMVALGMDTSDTPCRVTFSGGEPLMQRAFLLALLQESKRRGWQTCLDTSGFAPQESFQRVLPWVDFFQYDLKIMDEERHKLFTGVSNASILSNLEYLRQQGVRIYLRLPILPGINDDAVNFGALLDEAARVQPEQVELMPYQPQPESYVRLDKPFRMGGVASPSADALDALRQQVAQRGLNVI